MKIFRVTVLTYLLCFVFLTCSNAQHQPRVGSPAPFPTRVLKPETIHVTLASLPKPFATESARKPPQNIPRPADAKLAVPKGFSVNIFAENVENARWMAVAPNGDVFLVQSRSNRILVMRDKNQDGAADEFFLFADSTCGLDQPMGITFQENHVYVANTSGVVRYAYQPGQTQVKGLPEPFIPGISPGGYNQHWTRNLLFHQDRVYITIGSATNVDPEELPRASVQSFNRQGQDQQTYASGLRNPVGLAVNPVNRQIWATNTERDWLGDDLVPDFLTSLKPNGFYGWPYAYLSPDLEEPRRKGERPDKVKQTITPEVLFGAHSVPLGFLFYTGKQFPRRYRNDALVAFRGSSNRAKGTGYKIVRIPFDKAGKPEGGYEDFVTGWLQDPDIPSAWGRPVGLIIAPDGSLLIADETGGVIWRVSYSR